MSAMGHYDDHYRSGGFGYDADRAHWVAWTLRHYVEAFDLKAYGREMRPRLVDVACGDGFWTSVFSELGFDASGIDLSEGGVAVARDRYPHLEFYVGNAEMAFPTEAPFDVVFCRAISHLHREDLSAVATQRLTANLMRHVAPSGTLLVSYYTKRDGSGTSHHHYHPVSDLVRLFEAVGDVWRVDVVDDYVQLAVCHRAAGRRSSLLSSVARSMPAGLRARAVRLARPPSRRTAVD
jgi:SAM-dependent methyltransferase